jgi:hypothetical protein
MCYVPQVVAVLFRRVTANVLCASGSRCVTQESNNTCVVCRCWPLCYTAHVLCTSFGLCVI